MKQAKFALAATAVLAVIGGAVAFKSQDSRAVYTKSTTSTSFCNSLLGTGYISASTGVLLSFATSAPKVCNIRTVITKAE